MSLFRKILPFLQVQILLWDYVNSWNQLQFIQRRTTCKNVMLSSTLLRSKVDEQKNDVATVLQEINAFRKSSRATLASVKDDGSHMDGGDSDVDDYAREREELVQKYMKYSLVNIKAMIGERLKIRKVASIKGKKPVLARRLADLDIRIKYSDQYHEDEGQVNDAIIHTSSIDNEKDLVRVTEFAGISPLSKAASDACSSARLITPTPIQKVAIPQIYSGESVIVHAETGSGKTLAYLLPITEIMNAQRRRGRTTNEDEICIILTPTRELAAQVAGVANALAPKGTVRLVNTPSNLMDGGEKERLNGKRIFIGSAKAIFTSLYGDGKMPASPTPKPLVSQFVSNVRYLVLDEVDKLLNVSKVKKGGKNRNRKVHEKPAALLSNAIARAGLYQASAAAKSPSRDGYSGGASTLQVVAASATIGRPMRRELSRVLGLAASECPAVIRPLDASKILATEGAKKGVHVGRAITIPSSVRNYISVSNKNTIGALLVQASNIIKYLPKPEHRKILLVLTRNCGINVANAIGSLSHFNVVPRAQGLLDVLEGDTSDELIKVHQKVSMTKGVGRSNALINDNDITGYLYVTVEDSVRGLHLEGLDTVIIIGRSFGPDEYTHIAGRTGRAGKRGNVVNVLSSEEEEIVSGWESMLGIPFINMDIEGSKHFYYNDENSSANERVESVSTVTIGQEEQDKSSMSEDFSKMKLEELKNECKKHNLKVSGRKAELIQRLHDHFK